MKVINVNATIDLTNCINEHKESVKEIIKQSGIDATIQEDFIFLDNMINNENEFVESLASFVANKLPIGHDDLVFSCIGEDVASRYDVIVKQNKVYLQYYNLVPGEIEPYNS